MVAQTLWRLLQICIKKKNILPIGNERNSWSFESWPEALATKINAYACCIAHKRPERGRLGVFSVSVVKFYGFIKYCIYVLCVHAVSNLLTLWCLSMEQIHILLWIAKPRKMSSESLELVTQVCFSLFYVYWTRWYVLVQLTLCAKGKLRKLCRLRNLWPAQCYFSSAFPVAMFGLAAVLQFSWEPPSPSESQCNTLAHLCWSQVNSMTCCVMM